MKRLVVCVSLALVLLSAAARPVHAADLTARWGLGGQLGLQKLAGGAHDYSNVDQSATLWLRRGLGPRWSFDAGVHYGLNRPGALLGEDAGLTLGSVHAFYTTTFQVLAGARRQGATRGRFTPYAGLYAGVINWRVLDMNGIEGIGFFPDGPTLSGYDSDGAPRELHARQATGTLGLGTEWSAGANAAFDIGLRWTYLFGNHLDNIGSGNLWGPDGVDVNTELLEAYAGFTAYFGGNRDKDKDGIADAKDLCPREAEDFDGWQDADGCPDPDNDGDGILDVNDACPNDAEDFDGFRDADGCPDPDNDNDGVIDAYDKCPTEQEDRDGFQDADGCPDPDNDGDGVLDAADTCPDTPAGTTVDSHGCPLIAEMKGSMVLKGVLFRPSSAVLEPSSATALDEIVATLKTWPFVRVEIQGYTDDVGEAAANRQLSALRAEAVRAYLVTAGIDGRRLTAVGYGEDLPVADNTTEAGRATNRRVEMVRTDR